MSEVKKNTYWKSLNELAQNEEYEKFMHREFPENATELTDGVSRRGFLRVMGASIALAGFAACRRPVQKILPYSKQPEDIVPGIPLYYATSFPFQGNLTGLIVENHEGRPTKLEGNDLHPASKGNTNSYIQAAVLGLYDQERSRTIMMNGEKSNMDDFSSFLAEHFADRNKKIVFISEANSSPTYNSVKSQALSKFRNASWVTYEPFSEENALLGTEMAFGEQLRTYMNLENAKVILSLNDDFMGATHFNNVDYASQFAKGRKSVDENGELNRLYVVEDSFSVTGSAADNRLKLKASQVEAFTFALANELSSRVSGLNAFSSASNEFNGHKWIKALADDLTSNEGTSVVTAGVQQPAQVHAAVAAINVALGNRNETVSYHRVDHIDDSLSTSAFENAVSSIDSETTVVLVGTNPVYTAPANLNMGDALKKADVVIHLSDYADETSKLATWHVNRAHFLEMWGDGYSYTGSRSIIQPQIEPLHGGLSEIEFLNMIVDGSFTKGYDLIRETWQGVYRSNFENKWRTILHDGVDDNEGFTAVNARLSRRFTSSISGYLNSTPSSGIEVVIRPDNSVFDGRYANNGWLQELPDPMTKITWDNVALMSPHTAEENGLENEDLIDITVNGNTLTLPVWVQPGHVDNSVTLNVGYGRTGLGSVADVDENGGGGFDINKLRSTDAPLFSSATISKADGTYEIACVQDHHSLEGRDIYREATLTEYNENPEVNSFKNIHTYEVPGMKEAEAIGEDVPISLFDEQTFPEYEPQWGMVIDLNSCFGCGVCVIACQSENNIPVIGKREVKRGREMHWIRNDRYFVSSSEGHGHGEGGAGASDSTNAANDENLRAVHQPVPCMHCELAPCEQVCPVAATTHSEDGMNQMTYNRCIGTRYCANNCPYKVRRFNFFNYAKEYLTTGDDPEIIQMAMNPEVTVRFRGVMEKCTYCAQRVNRAKIDTKIETGSPKPADGTVVTACQQACPADAIYFGDLTDENSEVTKMKRSNRDYQVLEELNTRPRTSYAAKLRNPNPALA